MTPDSTKWDVTIESPEGRLFRNRQELSRHFEEARLEHNLDLFEFGLDTPLKKIRQIWKANLPVVEVQELRRSLVAANSGDSCNTSGTLMNSDF